MNESERKALSNAIATIAAVYEWVDKVEQFGGATTISGAAECRAMLKSLQRNRLRMAELVINPALAVLGHNP